MSSPSLSTSATTPSSEIGPPTFGNTSGDDLPVDKVDLIPPQLKQEDDDNVVSEGPSPMKRASRRRIRVVVHKCNGEQQQRLDNENLDLSKGQLPEFVKVEPVSPQKKSKQQQQQQQSQDPQDHRETQDQRETQDSQQQPKGDGQKSTNQTNRRRSTTTLVMSKSQSARQSSPPASRRRRNSGLLDGEGLKKRPSLRRHRSGDRSASNHTRPGAGGNSSNHSRSGGGSSNSNNSNANSSTTGSSTRRLTRQKGLRRSMSNKSVSSSNRSSHSRRLDGPKQRRASSVSPTRPRRPVVTSRRSFGEEQPPSISAFRLEMQAFIASSSSGRSLEQTSSHDRKQQSDGSISLSLSDHKPTGDNQTQDGREERKLHGSGSKHSARQSRRMTPRDENTGRTGSSDHAHPKVISKPRRKLSRSLSPSSSQRKLKQSNEGTGQTPVEAQQQQQQQRRQTRRKSSKGLAAGPLNKKRMSRAESLKRVAADSSLRRLGRLSAEQEQQQQQSRRRSLSSSKHRKRASILYQQDNDEPNIPIIDIGKLKSDRQDAKGEDLPRPSRRSLVDLTAPARNRQRSSSPTLTMRRQSANEMLRIKEQRDQVLGSLEKFIDSIGNDNNSDDGREQITKSVDDMSDCKSRVSSCGSKSVDTVRASNACVRRDILRDDRNIPENRQPRRRLREKKSEDDIRKADSSAEFHGSIGLATSELNGSSTSMMIPPEIPSHLTPPLFTRKSLASSSSSRIGGDTSSITRTNSSSYKGMAEKDGKALFVTKDNDYPKQLVPTMDGSVSTTTTTVTSSTYTTPRPRNRLEDEDMTRSTHSADSSIDSTQSHTFASEQSKSDREQNAVPSKPSTSVEMLSVKPQSDRQKATATSSKTVKPLQDQSIGTGDAKIHDELRRTQGPSGTTQTEIQTKVPTSIVSTDQGSKKESLTKFTSTGIQKELKTKNSKKKRRRTRATREVVWMRAKTSKVGRIPRNILSTGKRLESDGTTTMQGTSKTNARCEGGKEDLVKPEHDGRGIKLENTGSAETSKEGNSSEASAKDEKYNQAMKNTGNGITENALESHNIISGAAPSVHPVPPVAPNKLPVEQETTLPSNLDVASAPSTSPTRPSSTRRKEKDGALSNASDHTASTSKHSSAKRKSLKVKSSSFKKDQSKRRMNKTKAQPSENEPRSKEQKKLKQSRQPQDEDQHQVLPIAKLTTASGSPEKDSKDNVAANSKPLSYSTFASLLEQKLDEVSKHETKQALDNHGANGNLKERGETNRLDATTDRTIEILKSPSIHGHNKTIYRGDRKVPTIASLNNGTNEDTGKKHQDSCNVPDRARPAGKDNDGLCAANDNYTAEGKATSHNKNNVATEPKGQVEKKDGVMKNPLGGYFKKISKNTSTARMELFDLSKASLDPGLLLNPRRRRKVKSVAEICDDDGDDKNEDRVSTNNCSKVSLDPGLLKSPSTQGKEGTKKISSLDELYEDNESGDDGNNDDNKGLDNENLEAARGGESHKVERSGLAGLFGNMGTSGGRRRSSYVITAAINKMLNSLDEAYVDELGHEDSYHDINLERRSNLHAAHSGEKINSSNFSVGGATKTSGHLQSAANSIGGGRASHPDNPIEFSRGASVDDERASPDEDQSPHGLSNSEQEDQEQDDEHEQTIYELYHSPSGSVAETPKQNYITWVEFPTLTALESQGGAEDLNHMVIVKNDQGKCSHLVSQDLDDIMQELEEMGS